MGALVPRVHCVELCVGLMNDKYRTLGSALELGAGDYDSDFNDAVHHWVKAGHFAIEPDEVFIGFG